MIGGPYPRKSFVKRFTDEELAALVHALVLLAGLEPGDVLLEENDDGTLNGYLFGNLHASGPLHLVLEALGQGLWQFIEDQALDLEQKKTRLKR